MGKGLLHLALVLCCSLAGFGQISPVDTLFTINGTAYPSNNFIELYQNNKLLDENNKPLKIKDALDLYLDFHLKATEARSLDYGTIPEVRKEIESYHQLAFESYLYPVTISEQLISETFDRLQYFVKARHILIKVKGRATPHDTLVAYKEAQQVYSQLKSGKKFRKVADHYSDDLSVRKNHGELGYFTALDMDYAFESAAYNTSEPQFSKPVRSPYGYHIIQRTHKIPNPGKVQIKHLMLEFKRKANRESTKQKADSIYQLLKNGEDFTDLIQKHTDDTNSAPDKGVLPWFGLFETHPKIEKAAFGLKNINDFSKPIETEFGYHIIQLMDKKEYQNLDECRNELILLLSEDERSRITEAELIKNLKKKYQFRENRVLLSNFYSILDYAYAELWEPLFSIDGIDYSQEVFADYLSQQASKDIYENFKEYINRLYLNFSNQSILEFHKAKLVENNPELKSLLQDYENAVLVYFINKNTIWDKSNDSQNLQEYFSQNADKYGANVELKNVKDMVISDLRKRLEQEWMNKLREKYTVVINESTYRKIVEL